MAVATGIGSMPGTDFGESLRIVLDRLPDLPHLPELPARGVGAAMIGRTLGAFTHLGFDLQPAGWRLTDAVGIDQRRAASLLAQDLDRLEELTQGYTGEFKVSLVGPWTLAALVERPRGDKLLADVGARRELAQALAEAVGAHLEDLGRRVPGATFILQVDEPMLPAILGGQVPTASGFHRHRSVTEPEASQALSWVYDAVREAGASPLTHSCAADVPIGLLHDAGSAVSIDPGVLAAARFEELARCLDDRKRVYLGVAPTPNQVPWQPGDLIMRTNRLLDMLGFDPAEVTDYLVLTPACGLSGSGGVSGSSAETSSLVSSSLGAIHSAAQEVGA
jgi:hypothetical protein